MPAQGIEQPMNVLVTGAAGYVGSICTELLLARGLRIIALDNLREGHRKAVPRQAKFYLCDLADTTKLGQVFAREKINAVMHFAGEALVEKSVREPSTFYAGNIACGVHLLDAMVRHGVEKLIFSSTAAVYGEPEQVPIPEEHPKKPINPYGKSKWVFEQILADYRAYAGLQYVALRYFNAAGASALLGEAHRKETHLIPRVLDAALGKEKHVSVFGADYPTPDGTCLRDYVHVLDIAEAHILALKNLDRIAGNAFNVGNSRGYSILEVVEAARRITGRSIPHVLAPRRPGDPAVLVASSDKLKRELGWEARQSQLETIIASAWAWKLKHPNGYEAPVKTSKSRKTSATKKRRTRR
jgi:UDP-glucose 4-epimerase